MLVLKSSFTPQHHQSLHQKVLRPLETFDSRDFFSTAPLKSLLRSQWRFEVIGLPRFAHNDGFEVTGLLYFVHNDGLKSLDCFTSFAMTGWSRWITSLRSQWRVWSRRITSLCSQWQRKRIRFLFFMRGKLLKITSIVNFQLISSNP